MGTTIKQIIGTLVTPTKTTTLNNVVGTALTEAQLERIIEIVQTNAGFIASTSKIRSYNNQLQATIEQVQLIQLMILRMGGTQNEYDLAQSAIDELTALQDYVYNNGDTIATE